MEDVLFPDGEAEFVAVMDVNRERAQEFADKYGIAQAFGDVDEMLAKVQPHIVAIATPPAFHAPLAIKAMEAGAWVMCEKPLCRSLREMDAIQAAEDRTGKYCSSVAQFRFGGASQHIKRMMAEQVAGKVMVGTCHTTWYRDHEYYAMDWRGTWESELGGTTMGHGIHAIDSFLWTMGDWDEVQAICATIDRSIEVEDTSSASVRFANGAVGNILTSVLCPQQQTFIRYDFQLGTAWTEGAFYDLNSDRWHFQTLESLESAKAETFKTIPEDRRCLHANQLRDMVEDFHAGRRPLVSGNEARRTIEFITALYKSSSTGRAVKRGSIVEGDSFYDAVGGTMAQTQRVL